MSAVFKREFKSAFCNMTGAIFIAYLLLWFGIYTVALNLKSGVSQFEYTIANASFISLLAIPLLTMRSFSEEKHNGADKLLYSLPLKTSSIVLAKFFAIAVVFALPVIVVCLYPLMLSQFGTVYLNTAFSSILGYFLLGCALISIGMFISSPTESQVISATLSLGAIILIYFISSLAELLPTTAAFSLIALIIVSVLIGVVTYVLTKNGFAAGIVFIVCAGASIIGYILAKTKFESLVPNALKSLDLFGKLYNFLYGILDITSVVFYVSVSAFFVFLTVQAVEKKRWN